MNKIEYADLVDKFKTLLLEQQRKGEKERGMSESILMHSVSVEKGRKYDKVVMHATVNNSSVRYFIERKTGDIYGAKSWVAPNFNWYFGNINTASLWDWSDYHGRPVNDPSVRPVGRYGPYQRYMKI